VTVEEILGAEQPLHYRNKSIYPISPVGEVGFYRARSHQVVHVEHCLIQKPEADALAQAVRDYIARFQVEPYNEATGRGLLRHLYVRTSCRGESLACLLVNGSRLPRAAKAKRVNDRSNPSYKWVALAIVIAGLIALVYGVVSMIRGTNSVGIYFALFGLAAVFLFSGAHVLPTARNNKTALTREWEQAQADLAAVLPKDFPLPARYAHPVVLTRMIRVLREGRAQTADEALDVVKRDLKALTADVQVEQWEYDEVVAVKPMFLLSDYQ